MTVDDFAAGIKAKYPQYESQDNSDLASRFLEKYPQYKDQVELPKTEEPKSVKGLLQNAGKELVGAAETVKQGAYDLPKTLLKTSFQLAPGQGKSFGETDLAKETGMIGEAAKEIPGKIGEAVMHPLKTAYENPLTTLSLAVGGAKGMQSLAEKAVPKLGATLEAAGAKGQNFAAGLRPQTLEAMARAGENPGEIGIKVGSQLAQDKIIGSTPTETFNNLKLATKNAGKAVGDALSKIFKTGEDASVNAETALKPLNDAIEERAGAITSARKSMSKPFVEVRDYFLERTKENGKLSLQDVRKALKEVGPMTHKGSEEVQASMSELYGTLANVQENMVNQIAEAVGDPKLKTALLEANQKYSLYKRVGPDLERAAAKEAVGKGSSIFSHPIEAMKKYAATKVSGVMNKTGTAMKGFPVSDSIGNRAALQSVQDKLKNLKK